MGNNNPRTVYVYSTKDRDYMTREYHDVFREKNAILKKGTASDLKTFIENNDTMQLDTETNVTDFYSDRVLRIVQLGDLDGTEQHIIDYSSLEDWMYDRLSNLLKSETTFLAHNAKFEYIILYKTFGIYIKNFKDTMLASQLITAGLETPKGYNGLKNLVQLTFGVELGKEEQTTFDGQMMTPNQLLYADTDVLYLGRLLKALMGPLKRWKLLKVFNLENKSLRPIGDMTINGVDVNQVALSENIVTYDERAKVAKNDMIKAFREDDGKGVQEKLREINVIQEQDEIVINWKSSTQKRVILQYLYPDLGIVSTAKAQLTKLVNAHDEEKEEPLRFIEQMLSGETEHMEMILVSRHLDFLKEHDMFKARGQLNLNFNSPAQLLEFFKVWYPTLTSVGVKSLKRLKHPVVKAYQKYAKANKLVSSFGSKMFDFIESDGRIHTSFNQLVKSGSRVSSSKPNMLQAPSNAEYRRIFIPPTGWKLVDSDYASIELFLAAYLAKDKGMLFAIENGYDVHSYCCTLLFGKEWTDAGESLTPTGKPKSAEGNRMRKLSKMLSFGLLYGSGVTTFSDNAGITLSEGKVLMKLYFDTFPQLSEFFTEAGNKALRDYYIREPHFNRVRFFNRPKNAQESSHVKNAAMNYQPQASNGSITKYALCKIKKYIEDNNVDHKVKLLLTIYDQITSCAREDYAEEWAKVQTRLMEEAALHAIPEGTIRSETDILDHWTK